MRPRLPVERLPIAISGRYHECGSGNHTTVNNLRWGLTSCTKNSRRISTEASLGRAFLIRCQFTWSSRVGGTDNKLGFGASAECFCKSSTRCSSARTEVWSSEITASSPGRGGMPDRLAVSKAPGGIVVREVPCVKWQSREVDRMVQDEHGFRCQTWLALREHRTLIPSHFDLRCRQGTQHSLTLVGGILMVRNTSTEAS